MDFLTSNTDHKYMVVRTYSRAFFDSRNIDVKEFIGTFYGPYEIFDIILSNDQTKYAIITEIKDAEFELIVNSNENKIQPATWEDDNM